MVLSATHSLDNPIWTALTTSQVQFAEISNLARRFPNAISSLAAFSEPTPESLDSLASLVHKGESAALFLNTVPVSLVRWVIVESVPLLQMIYESCPLTAPAIGLQELTSKDLPQMMSLAELTKPGPFGRRTNELGTFLGIQRSGSLVSMAGERLRMPGYAEISAVCTHPEHSGRGYARALTAALIHRILRRGEVPFLHVRQENKRAIELYSSLGFRERRLFQLVVLRRCGE